MYPAPRADNVTPATARNRAAIMQPYFLPYIGYFQLIAAADVFVIYDNIQYTKKGWINRNRLMLNGSGAMFSIPIKQGSDSLTVVERQVADRFSRIDLIRQLRAAYQRAPHFASAFPVIEEIIRYDSSNLFDYVAHSVGEICGLLAITTPTVKSSSIPIDHGLKAQDKVVALCEALRAAEYVNPSGGSDLYSMEHFASHRIDLKFIRSRPIEYPQFGNPFVPSLSIVDVVMFNPLSQVREWAHHEFDLT
jgi:hypothetical protein